MMAIGVIIHQWPIFLVIYGFWLETLIISLFDTLKILLAKGENAKPPSFKLAFQFLLFKLGTLLFYLLFIVVFVGLLNSQKEEFIKISNAIYFRDKIFNSIILSVVLGCLLNFIIHYWMELRSKYGPKHFFNFIDARTLTIHVVVVVGTMALEFFHRKYPESNIITTKTIFIFIFILVKTISELISSQFNGNEEEIPSPPNSYI